MCPSILLQLLHWWKNIPAKKPTGGGGEDQRNMHWKKWEPSLTNCISCHLYFSKWQDLFPVSLPGDHDIQTETILELTNGADFYVRAVTKQEISQEHTNDASLQSGSTQYTSNVSQQSGSSLFFQQQKAICLNNQAHPSVQQHAGSSFCQLPGSSLSFQQPTSNIYQQPGSSLSLSSSIQAAVSVRNQVHLS